MVEPIEMLRTACSTRPLPRSEGMCPELSYGRHRGPGRYSSRRAAVLIALYEHQGQWWFPLTVRNPRMSRHQGQISLPGGLIEPGEESSVAAVREFTEELGARSVQILDRLDDCYVYVSDTVVTPWIGWMDRPHNWQPNFREVERVIDMPVAALHDLAARQIAIIHRGPLQFAAPGFAVADDHVWGATAVILEQLAEVLRTAYIHRI